MAIPLVKNPAGTWLPTGSRKEPARCQPAVATSMGRVGREPAPTQPLPATVRPSHIHWPAVNGIVAELASGGQRRSMLVLAAVARLSARRRGGTIPLQVARLRAMTGYSRSHVYRALAELEAEGLIEHTRRCKRRALGALRRLPGFIRLSARARCLVFQTTAISSMIPPKSHPETIKNREVQRRKATGSPKLPDLFTRSRRLAMTRREQEERRAELRRQIEDAEPTPGPRPPWPKRPAPEPPSQEEQERRRTEQKAKLAELLKAS